MMGLQNETHTHTQVTGQLANHHVQQFIALAITLEK